MKTIRNHYRHFALNLSKQEKTAKVGIQNRRLLAGWDNDYLLRILICRQFKCVFPGSNHHP
ncbi:MAG TPA: hypothetical protein EYH19_09005 [Desulfocapsa sulfexigens]|nr:hypothetical protein [Desulfocapsa sulfexigens]